MKLTDDIAVENAWAKYDYEIGPPWSFESGFSAGLEHASEQAAAQLESSASKWEDVSVEVSNVLREQAAKIRSGE